MAEMRQNFPSVVVVEVTEARGEGLTYPGIIFIINHFFYSFRDV